MLMNLLFLKYILYNSRGVEYLGLEGLVKLWVILTPIGGLKERGEEYG